MTNESSKGQNTSAEETLRQRSFRACTGTDGAEIQYSWTSIDILPDNIWMSDE